MVLVHGASGAVGLAAVQLAVNSGMNVIGTAGTAEGIRLIKDNGAQFAFNHRDPDYLDEMKKSIGGSYRNACRFSLEHQDQELTEGSKAL